MTLNEFRHSLLADLFRYHGRSSWLLLMRDFLFTFQMRYTFFLRLCSLLRGRAVCFPFYVLSRAALQHYSYKYGIDISPRMPIGPGLYIGHCGGIVISHKATIGLNCNLSHDVTIGLASRGKRAGVPTIGDNVYIGPGAKIFGAITIGNNVAIGANCVVTHDVPDNAVVVGIPATIASMAGSAGYVNNTDYDSPVG